MKQKYFGIIPEELNYIDKAKELEEFLISEKVLTQVRKGRNIESSKTDNLGELKIIVELDPKNVGYEFTNSFVKEVYKFLLKHYKNGLGKIHLFNNDFRNETFGKKESEKREIALEHFNKIYPIWTANLVTVMEYDEDHNLKSENYFNKLNRSRIFIQNNLKYEIELLTAYLIGGLDYFNRNLFESNKIISEMFDFENDLLILIELNKRYGFTEDKVFIPKTIAENIYSDYPENFESLKQLQFIEEKLTIEGNRKPSYIVSLYFFFQSEEVNLKIPKEINFREILLHYFDLKLKRLKVSDSSNNKHQLRMRTIKNEWFEFKK